MIRRLLVLLALLLPVPAAAAELDMNAIARVLSAKGAALADDYVETDGAATAEGFSDLYFEVFEDSGMEQALGMRSPATKTELEALFGDVIGKAGQNRPKAEISAAWRVLDGRLTATAAAHANAATGWIATFVQSFLILLREGFEAMLVITALVATLRRSGQGDKLHVIGHGVGWALVASLAAAWALTQLPQMTGRNQEALEGAVMLLAAAVLFHVSFWLLSKREAQAWQDYVKAQVDSAARSGRLWALGLAAFLAVFREGAETVLFYQALVLSSPGEMPAVLTGIAVAALALAVLYWAMRALSFRLPIRLFFTATAGLLFFLAVSFAGRGVLELQEGQLLPITPVDALPRIEWLGLFPTVESIGAQALLVIPMLAALLWHARRQTMK
jgi:high-affinity iron transporter